METQNWRMVAAPPAISAEDKTTLVDTIEKMVTSDSWKATIAQKGWISTFLAGAEFETYLNDQVEKTTAILKQLGIAQ